jgi:hypothetical protein
MSEDADLPHDAEEPAIAPAHPLEAPIAELAAQPHTTHVADAIRAWLSKHIHNSPVSRDTEAMNHLTASLPALQASLEAAPAS